MPPWSRNSTAASHSLAQETEQLSSLIGQFRVGDGNEGQMRRELQKVAPHAFRQAPPRGQSRQQADARPVRVVNGGAASDDSGGAWEEF